MPFNWQSREAHWAVLRTRLEVLRRIFPKGPREETFGALFDEFLEHREFGLALEVLCDFLLEPDAPPPSETEFNEIAMLHALMEVQNDCLLRLGDRRQRSLPE
ncbi:MAG: MafI family immunity protein, partial [Candidatus Acidiferrum sp.]